MRLVAGANAQAARAQEPTPASGLVERDGEMAVLRGALRSAARGTGAVLVIEGPAGVGRSRLLAEAEAIAGAEGLATLCASGREKERGFSFGGVLQLFESRLALAHLEERVRLLSGPAQPAAPLLTGGPREAPADVPVLPLFHGLHALAENLSAGCGLALLIDDALLLDEPSLRFLLYLADRVGEIGACLVLTTRSGPACERSPSMDALASRRDTVRLALRPLSAAGVASQLRASLFPTASGDFCAACYRATGGNHYLLQELAGKLAAEDAEASPDRRRVRSSASGSIAASTRRRARGLGSDAEALTIALAVLGDGSFVARAAAVAGLSTREASAQAAGLVEAGVLREMDGLLAFAHPIVARSLIAELRPEERDRLEARAALEDRRRVERALADLGRPQQGGAGAALDGESLTPRERQVCELAAQGSSNSQIAAALFVTVKTVEWHLSRAFRKLGLRSRAELSSALEAEAAGRSPPADR